MDKIKYYTKEIIKNILVTLFILFIISTMYYFHLINDPIMSLLSIIIPLLICFITSYKTGRIASKNGYLEGLKIGIIIVMLYIILSLILFIRDINIKTFIYYIIIILTSITGSTIGINKNKDKN